jgi:RNA recognition motif-containing protein
MARKGLGSEKNKMIQSRVFLLLFFCKLGEGFLSPLTGTYTANIIRLLSSKDSYLPPDSTGFAIDNDAEDPYSEQVSKSPRGPKRSKRKNSVTNMAGTSWMQKNVKFSGQNVMSVEEESIPQPRRNARTESSERGDRGTKNFRQDFRGTRVFVQGIPPGTAWQDLKDHFKIAGDVVFASVSVDMQTGESKGHGIVQFETTEMAQNAIDIMRDHTLNGSPLYVREDVQENVSNAQLRSLPKGPTPPTKWKCANEDNAAYMLEEELSNITTLIKARDDARRRRKFEVSDRIREELKDNHGVFIDDRLKMWWTARDGNKVPQTIEDIKGDGRWKLKLNPWRQIPTTPDNDACVNADLVEGLLKQRDIARREKDFGTADSLLEEARTSPDGELALRIHDESRTWRIWTAERPPEPVEHIIPKDPIEARKEAAKECFNIVEEFAPDKINEITMVLSKFPGREFQVLKRLKNQYL